MQLIRQPLPVAMNGHQYNSYILCDDTGNRFTTRDSVIIYGVFDEIKRCDDYRRFHGKYRFALLDVYPLKDQGQGYWIEMFTPSELKDVGEIIPIRLPARD
jgi:hypothetical protein